MFNAFHQSNFKRALKNLLSRRQKNVVLLEAHFGLGDNLICLGLMRAIAENNPGIRYHLACLPQYFHSIAWMLESSKNIFPTVVTSGREARQLANFLNATYQTIGIHNIDIKRFDESFMKNMAFHLTIAGPSLQYQQVRDLMNSSNNSIQIIKLIYWSAGLNQVITLIL